LLQWPSAEEIHAGPGDVRWNRIAVANDSLVLVVGGEKFSRGDMLRSLDGGRTWEHIMLPGFDRGVYGLGLDAGGRRCVLTGFSSTSLRAESIAAGVFQTSQLPEDAYYISAALPAANRVVVATTVTNRAGNIWVLDSTLAPVKKSEFLFGLSDLLFVDAQRGVVAGFGAVLRTTDGGETWSYCAPVEDNFTAIHRAPDGALWVCGYGGSIWRGSPDATEWTRLRNGNDLTAPRYHLNDIVFLDAHCGYAIGEDGVVLHTDDGGQHWARYKGFTDAHLRSIAFLPGGEDLLVCGDGGALWRLRTR